MGPRHSRVHFVRIGSICVGEVDAAGCCTEARADVSLSGLLAELLRMSPDIMCVLRIFMAVPTVYAKLLEFSRSQPSSELRSFRALTERMRLHACGSAALPDTGTDSDSMHISAFTSYVHCSHEFLGKAVRSNSFGAVWHD
jgi:hypothetical protein